MNKNIKKLFPSDRFILRQGLYLQDWLNLKSFCNYNGIQYTYKPHLKEIWFSRFNPENKVEFQILKLGIYHISEACKNNSHILNLFSSFKM